MYYPFLRGKQNEIMAVRELIKNNKLSKKIIPIIEPMRKNTSTLRILLEMITDANNGNEIIIIINPAHGDYKKDNKSLIEFIKKYTSKSDFVIVGILINNSNVSIISKVDEEFNDSRKAIIYLSENRSAVELIRKLNNVELNICFDQNTSGYFRKDIDNVVMLSDVFPKMETSSDYEHNVEKEFTEDHISYIEKGYKGFADFATVGDSVIEGDYAPPPKVFVLHTTYKKEDEKLYLRHFCSKVHSDIQNRAFNNLKYLDLRENLISSNLVGNLIPKTISLDEVITNSKPRSSGYLKRISVKHHLEILTSILG